ncbi:hypothetical protein MT418_002154 [Batrachochytrium dendrobatidis]
MKLIPSVQLYNGVNIPCIGLGTFKLKGEEAVSVVQAAIKLGYCHIDSAASYNNEREIGQAISQMIQSGIVCRKKLFITSKIGPKSQGYEKACESIKNSLDRFGSDVGYIDLMLIHWPGSQGMKPEDPQHKINRVGTWRAMEEAYKAGSIRAIGVSNYTVKHIQEFTTMMHENKCTDPDDVLTMPMINQFELHPLLWNDTTQKLIETCHNLDCRVAGYSCFGSGVLIDGSAIGNNGLTLADFSTKIGATVSQVLIKWAITRGDIVMPKARSEAHLLENLNAAYLELSDEDLKWIDSLAQISGIKRFCWDPTNVC